VRWLPSDPLAIQEREALGVAVTAAVERGLEVVFATYPYPPAELAIATPAGYGAWLTALAGTFPQVRQYVVGNEPNQPAFFRPQFGRGGVNASAALFGRYLAAGYDALKAVDPGIKVIGVGLSPRGNDRPAAKSNISTSPVRFLVALGAWYRSSGRTLALMDGFSFHPYPNLATDPLERGYPWPNIGFANLDLLKQTLWDAFDGTPQPTTVEGLRLHLDEVGWQVDTSELFGYSGSENVAVTDENTQAAIYRELATRALCDADIAELNFFGFYDDALRTGFQAALHRADGTPRPALDAVKEVLAGGEAGCLIPLAPWVPARAVIGVKRPLITRVPGAFDVEVRANEGATALVCVFPGVCGGGAAPEQAGQAASSAAGTRRGNCRPAARRRGQRGARQPHLALELKRP
jgi:hypothetical protein